MKLSLRKAPLCLSLSMTAVSPHPTHLCPSKVTRFSLLRTSRAANSSSAGAPKFSRSNTEQHADNSFLRNLFIHSWTHIGIEFTQYVCCTASTPGEDTIAANGNMYCRIYVSFCNNWQCVLQERCC